MNIGKPTGACWSWFAFPKEHLSFMFTNASVMAIEFDEPVELAAKFSLSLSSSLVRLHCEGIICLSRNAFSLYTLIINKMKRKMKICLPWSRSSEQMLVFLHEIYSVEIDSIYVILFKSSVWWLILALLLINRSGNLVPQLRRFECYYACWLSSWEINASIWLAPIWSTRHLAGSIVRDFLRGLLR